MNVQNDTTNPSERNLSWRVVALGIAAVFLVHSSVVLALYRGRVVTRGPVFESDAIVFWVPLLIAYSAIARLYFRSSALRHFSPLGRVLGILALSLVVAFFSFCCSMLLPLNLYGS